MANQWWNIPNQFSLDETYYPQSVNRGYDFTLGDLILGRPLTDENRRKRRLSVEFNHRTGNAGKPHMGMKAKVSPFSPALVKERIEANKRTGTFSPELLADLRSRGVGARHHAGMGKDTFVAKKEEDEYGFLDAMFLANLVAGMQGGPPPTPYGTAVGGGNKTWASLPSLMRMS